MEPTHLLGKVTTIVPGQVTVNLRAIDRLSADLFDFTGTGLSPALDADPTAYEIATGTLTLTGLATDRTARFVGFVAPFGAAPPDFAARTAIGYGEEEERFNRWWPADIHFIGKDITRFHCALWPRKHMLRFRRKGKRP